MDLKGARNFFQEVDEMQIAQSATGATNLMTGNPIYEYDRDMASQWVTMARTALESVVPRGHAILRQLRRSFRKTGTSQARRDLRIFAASFEPRDECLRKDSCRRS
jgi:hypothetical protein